VDARLPSTGGSPAETQQSTLLIDLDERGSGAGQRLTGLVDRRHDAAMRREAGGLRFRHERERYEESRLAGGALLRRRETIALLVPVVVLFVVAIPSSFNIGVRHILPVYPLLAITGAVSAGLDDEAAERAERLAERLEHPSARRSS